MTSTRLFTALLAALTATVAPATAAPAAPADAAGGPDSFRRFALAVGSSHGGPGRDTLLYAESDARAFGTLLAEMGGVAPGDAQVLRGPDPEGLERAFRDLRARVAAVRKADAGRSRTEVILYYSGHADERGLLLEGRSLPYDRYRGLIDSIPADVRIAVLDACASGAITRLKGGRRRPAFAVDASSSMRGYAFLTSSSPDEASQESDLIKGSFFTHSLVSGLRGAADVSGDGKVTLGEAYHFAFHETLARTERTKGGPQHPAYDMKLSGTGDVVMTDMRQTSAGLVLAKDLEGRLFVRERDGRLVAELYKPAGRGMELGLAPGAYSVRLEQRKALSASSLELAEGRRTTLSPADFEPVHLERTTLRGGPSPDTVSDGVPPPPAPHPGHSLSVGILFDRQKEAFHGLQLTLFFNQAAASLHGGQASAFGNLAQGPVRGAQVTAMGNVATDTLRGAQAAGLFNVSPEPVVGLQAAGLFNVSGGTEGGQAAGTLNISEGPVRGGQGAGVLNYARGLRGGQGAGVVNINAGKGEGGQGAGVANLAGGMRGGMGAGVANVAWGPVSGGMGAGVANLAFAPVAGGQGAGVLNVAGGVAGAQAAGVANLAFGPVRGAQVAAVLNAAGDVRGWQVGLVNISRDIRGGAPVGLLNYSHTGLHSMNLWTDEMGYQHSTLLSGSRHVYTYFSLGTKLASDRNLQALGFGVGGQRAFGAWFAAADLGAFNMLEDWDFDTDEDHDAPELYRLRVQAGREVLPFVSLFGGVTGNWLWNHTGREGHLPWGEYQAEPFENQYVWPGLFLGLRLGR